ncbi:43944_t:CDS:2, partial [Gigaspora margarita]
MNNSDRLNSLFNEEEEDNSDVELLVSTLTSISTSVSNSSTLNLNVIKKIIYKKTNRSESFVWKFFEKYMATESIDNKEEQFEKPISIVKNDEFRLWAKGLDLWFEVPCVNTIKTIIFNSYTSATRQITNLIQRYSFELHEIMLDMGKLNKHCASDIVKLANCALNKFDIDYQKIFSITTDNGSNIKAAMQQIDVTNVKYASYTLQLSINLGLKKVEELISKYKALISILLKEKNNSTLYAIEHLLHLKPAIAQLYLTLTNYSLREVRKGAETMGFFISSLEEFELLKELIEILSSFDEVMQFLSGSKYPTLGFMMPILEELARRLRYFNRINDTAIFDMRRQFNELYPTPATNNNKATNNDNETSNDNLILTLSYQHKKAKMLAFFTHLQSENLNA